MDGCSSIGGLGQFTPLATELGDLKRIRDASSPDSLAVRLFRRAWGEIAAGHDPWRVAMGVTADAVVATQLGGITRGVLIESGVGAVEAAEILARGFDEHAGLVSSALREAVGLGGETFPVPAFAEALIRQPRAGATCPGKPRIILEPPENHGDHCLVVAVLGVVLAEHYRADPAAVFLAGLAHHLHNASLPDSGFAGEILLGDALEPLMRRLFARELATLESAVAASVGSALALIGDADTPEGRAFNAADVIDRVLQMRQYDRVAAFTVDQALDDLNLVHAGPLQAFHQAVLREAGLP